MASNGVLAFVKNVLFPLYNGGLGEEGGMGGLSERGGGVVWVGGVDWRVGSNGRTGNSGVEGVYQGGGGGYMRDSTTNHPTHHQGSRWG